MVAVMTTAYFAPPEPLSSGTLLADTGMKVTTPGLTLDLLGGFPLTLTYTHLPAGATLTALLCPSAESIPACQGGSYQQVLFNASSDSFTFQLQGGQALVLLTQAGGVSYHVTSPLWAAYSTLFLVLTIGGFVATLVGITLEGNDDVRNTDRPSRAPPRRPVQELPPPDPPQEMGDPWPPPEGPGIQPEEPMDQSPGQSEEPQGEWG